MRRRRTVLALIVGSAWCLSCGSSDDHIDAGLSDTIETAIDVRTMDATEVQAGLPTEEAGCLKPPKLDFVLELGDDGKPCKGQKVCEIVLSYSEDRDLEVVLTECGTPVAGAGITYEKLNDQNGQCQLESPMAYTDADGVASSTIGVAKLGHGQFQVHVCEYGVPETECVDFNVGVFGEPPIPLLVGFADYEGSYPLIDNAKVYLFKQGEDGKPACEDLMIGNLPTATIVGPMESIHQVVLFIQLPNLETEKVQNYSILGLARAGDGPVQAWGCEDGSNPGKPTEVQWLGHIHVELELKDLLPEL